MEFFHPSGVLHSLCSVEDGQITTTGKLGSGEVDRFWQDVPGVAVLRHDGRRLCPSVRLVPEDVAVE